MSFQKFVKRSTRGILIFIVVVMVFSLILWGYAGPSDDATLAEPAGVIFGTITITKGEFNRHLDRALVDYRLRNFRGRGSKETPKPGELEKITWENLVLLEDARGKGVSVTEKEKWTFIRNLYRYFGLPLETDLRQFAGDFFGVNETAFLGWAADRVVIDKLLGLVMESHFSDYRGIYDRVIRDNRLARAWVAKFDPETYAPKVRPPRPDEIVKYYEQNKEKFKAPSKIRVSCLLVGLDPLKKKVAEPTGEAIRKHYEDNLLQYTENPDPKAAAPAAESEAPQGRQKSLEEVRDEIVDHLKSQEARGQARKIATRINSEIGAACNPETGKYPEGLFKTLREKYLKEGVELSLETTAPFHAKQVEEIEKQVGTESGLAEWGFEGGRADGDISNMTWTSKGVAFFRMKERKEVYDPGLTEPVRRRIVKTLESEQLNRRVQQAATRVVEQIGKLGFGEARRRGSVAWRPTRYFRTPGETGLEDPKLAEQVSRRVSQMEPGKAQVIPGSLVAGYGEKNAGAYVVYLDDVIATTPEDVESLFKERRASMDRFGRMMRGREFIDALVKSAEIQDLMTPEEEKKDGKPEGPPSN